MQPAIKMALRIARQGSEYLNAHFERQDPATVDDAARTQLDRAEASIYANFSEQLQKAYKDHYIAPAGDIDAAGHDLSWHVFPLIGSDNFLRGIPEFVLALVQKKGNRAEHMLVVNPITGEEYSASRGHGAALNSRRIRMNGAQQIGRATLSTNVLEFTRETEDPLVWGELISTLARESGRVRTCGCTLLDMARASAGHLDGIVVFRPTAVEQALGLLLTHESGGLSGDFSGNPSSQESSRQLAIANPKLFKDLLKTLHPFRGRLPR
ncbi:inositol monophosphatase [Marinobacter sp. R17]|uniref:inositol monophosphatase family protein n=1 Tax=Marinobacter sp. R17 TaxID=2484250 RepID=UPI000F4BDDA7|nr:inositol monophosphatase family protein [Marinobacter sp. R17]ROU01551.1 inositol monophosphatase [Marinobacter sp. R17]